MASDNPSGKEKTLYRATVWLFLAFKAVCVAALGFRYTDSDQTVMWQAAMDMAGGDFHNLFWYGQTYSSNLESLLAVPLIWLKVPVNQALPIVSGLLAALPVYLFADIAARNGRYGAAVLVLLVSLAFPDKHWQTAMLSRGFIQGIACVSLGVYLLYRTRMSVMFAVAGLLIAGGIWQNPNAVFLLGVLPLVAHRFRPLSRISIALSGAVAATLMWFALRALAVRHLEYVIHPEPNFDWSFQNLIERIHHFADFIAHTLPNGLSAVLMLVGFLYLIPKNKKTFASLLLAVIILLVISGLKKTADFSDNVFFGPGRYLLAMPYLLLFILMHSEKAVIKLNVIISSFVVLCLFVFYGLSFVRNCNIEYMCREYAPVFAEKVTELEKNCEEIRQVAQKHNIDFVIMGDHYMLETVTCGCKGFFDDFPIALRPKYERRGWLWAQYGKQIPGKVLFMDSHLPEDAIGENYLVKKVSVRGNGYILSTGNSTHREIMQRLFPAEHFH